MYQVPRTLGLVLLELLKDRIFIFGFALKLVLIFLLIPEVQEKWFLPFMVQTFENPSINPWSFNLESGGSSLAFPYGPIMFLAHFPLTFFGWLTDSLVNINYFSGLGLRVGLLMSDILILVLLLQRFEDRWRGLVIHYWLSPLVIFITYWHGQTDIVPVAILVLCIALLKDGKILQSSLAFAASVTAKHSMIIVLPFIIMYLWFRYKNPTIVYKFFASVVMALVTIEGFYLFDAEFQQMVIYNKEVEKIYWLSIPMGDALKVYIIPLVYFLLLYFTWRLRQMDFYLLLAILGVAFSIVILLTPPTPGWVLWITPMLAIHLSSGSFRSSVLSILFSLIFIVYHFLYSTGSSLIFSEIVVLPTYLNHFFAQPHIQSLLNTAVIVFFILIILQMFRDSVQGSGYYCLGKKSLVVGVSGNLNSGKTTFVNALSRLFGNGHVLKISEDSYYNWHTHSPMWKKLTSLDPRSSHLHKMTYDVQNVLDGKSFPGYVYNQKSKEFIYKENQNARQVVLIDSVFSLYSEQLVEMEDLSIFLEIDHNFATEKKYSGQKKDQTDREKSDFLKYIQPQKVNSDMVFTLLPTNPEIDITEFSDSRINLNILIKNGLYHQKLLKVLTGICGLQVNIKQDNLNVVEIDVQGDVDIEDIKLASKIITPGMHEFIDDSGFFGGKLGLMQLITLAEVDYSLKRRKRRGLC